MDETTIPKAAELTGVPEQQIKHMVNMHLIPCNRDGNRIRVRLSDVESRWTKSPQRFLDERCELEGGWTRASVLYEAYCAWSGIVTVSVTVFSLTLKKAVRCTRKADGVYYNVRML